MPEIPNFLSAFFGTIILGIGYIGLWLKYKLDDKDFYQLKVFDKTIQSLILGIISLIITINMFNINKVQITTEEQLLSYILNHSYIIYVDFLVISIFVIYWKVFEGISRDYDIVERLKRTISEFKKKFKKP